ncbi:MAG: urease accessory protein UreD [Chloroflexota bacterium]
MTESQFRPPLQVMRAVTDAAGCACVYILSPTGGIVQGDRYTIGVTVEEDAHALVTTLAATKIYRMPNEHAEQHVHIEVKPGAILEFVPDAAILFRDADFRQSIHITLHGGALLMFHDSVMPGRLASGESLQFRRFRNRLTVTDPHGLLLYEQQDVQPQVQALTRVGTLEQFRCWAGWYLLGDLDRIGLDARAFCENYQPPDDVLASASRLYRNGVSVRLLAGYWSPLSQALDQLRNTIRRDFMHLPATNLRK